MSAYVGPRDVLEIDLTHETSRRYALDEDVFRYTLGGVGLAVYLLERALSDVPSPVDPLGPENPLIFAAGPFGSTPVPAGNKHAVATLSPLTGFVNEGLSSSHWSASLRRCGLAALVVIGSAREWTTVGIDGERVRFGDARELLGLSARDTMKRMRERHTDRLMRVCAIGPAGENGVSFASLENDGRQAGRGGSGAVMGAKRLKAIGLRGRWDVPLADPERTAELAEALKVRTLGPKTAKYRVLGTGANLRVLARMGQLPTRNFTGAIFEGADAVSPERARESRGEFMELRAGCAGCPVQCEHMYVRRTRDRKAAASSEYESVWAFGPNCGVSDLEAVLDAIGACDAYGIDTISTGVVIAFAMECAERGLVPRDAFGPELRFGNADVLLPAIEAIVHGTGLGALLGRGVRAAAATLGPVAQDFAMHAKGLELPGYEPRALPTYALGLSACTRGGCHNRAATYDLDLREPGVARDADQTAEATIAMEDYAAVWDSLVLCKFVRDCFSDFYSEAAELFTAVTGLRIEGEDLRRSAGRTWDVKRRINARQGWTQADDALPARLFSPIADGPLAGKTVDREALWRAKVSYERLREAQRDVVYQAI